MELQKLALEAILTGLHEQPLIETLTILEIRKYEGFEEVLKEIYYKNS